MRNIADIIRDLISNLPEIRHPALKEAESFLADYDATVKPNPDCVPAAMASLMSSTVVVNSERYDYCFKDWRDITKWFALMVAMDQGLLPYAAVLAYDALKIAQNNLASCRDACDPDFELVLWDKYQEAMDGLKLIQPMATGPTEEEGYLLLLHPSMQQGYTSASPTTGSVQINLKRKTSWASSINRRTRT